MPQPVSDGHLREARGHLEMIKNRLAARAPRPRVTARPIAPWTPRFVRSMSHWPSVDRVDLRVARRDSTSTPRPSTGPITTRCSGGRGSVRAWKNVARTEKTTPDRCQIRGASKRVVSSGIPRSMKLPGFSFHLTARVSQESDDAPANGKIPSRVHHDRVPRDSHAARPAGPTAGATPIARSVPAPGRAPRTAAPC